MRLRRKTIIRLLIFVVALSVVAGAAAHWHSPRRRAEKILADADSLEYGAIQKLLRSGPTSAPARPAREQFWLWRWLGPTGPPETFGEAEDRLVALGPGAVEPLVAALSHQSSDVRAMVARVLGRIGDCRATQALVAVMGDEDTDVHAIGALGRLRDLAAVGPLIAEFKADAAAHVVSEGDHGLAVIGNWPELAAALGMIGDRRAVDPLLEALEELPTDDDLLRTLRAPQVVAVIWALGEIGDARATKAIEPWVDAIEDGRFREQAQQALRKIRGELPRGGPPPSRYDYIKLPY